MIYPYKRPFRLFSLRQSNHPRQLIFDSCFEIAAQAGFFVTDVPVLIYNTRIRYTIHTEFTPHFLIAHHIGQTGRQPRWSSAAPIPDTDAVFALDIQQAMLA